MKKSVIAFLIVVLATMACGGNVSASQAESSVNVNLPIKPLVAYDDLQSGLVYTGQGVMSAVEIACDCSINEFTKVASIVERNGAQVLYIKDLRTLKNMAAFENSALFTAQPGDIVYFGKVKTVAEKVQSGTLTAETAIDPNGVETIYISGGELHQPISIKIEIDRRSWGKPLYNKAYYVTIDDAYYAAIQ